MKAVKFLFLLVAFLLVEFASGQEIKCKYCQKPIVGDYIIVDGFKYHRNHFLCANCNKPIEGKYFTKNDKYYHDKCFELLFLPKCAVCNKSINGEYLIDSFGNKIHKHHEAEIDRCDNCNRIISENTTNGGIKYIDGRKICNICYGNRINSIYEYKSALSKVITRLKDYGLHFSESSISLKIVSLSELQKVSESRYSRSVRGFTHTLIKTLRNKKSFEHTIYVLNMIPSKYAESTIAHELMHIWISENIAKKLTPKLEEGSCNYISYIYLKSDYSQDAKDIIKQLKESPDKIYGDGYRKVFERFNGREFSQFLNYLKTNASI